MADKIQPPEPGLTWLALESVFCAPPVPYPSCLWVDVAPRLREAWKTVKAQADPLDEVVQSYLDQATDAGKRRNWVDCAGWIEAARRRIAGEDVGP